MRESVDPPMTGRPAMKVEREHITRVLENEFAKISEVRLLIKKLTALEDPLEDSAQLLKQLEEKEEEVATLYQRKHVNYQPVLKGHLSIGGKPGVDRLAELAKLNTDTVVTLLKTNEKGVDEIKAELATSGTDWIWFPLSASELSLSDDTREKINAVYRQLIDKLNHGERIFIHCAAGVHRTGSFTNGLLRKIGYSSAESKQLIKEMRPVTALEAVKRHWDWSEKIFTEGD